MPNEYNKKSPQKPSGGISDIIVQAVTSLVQYAVASGIKKASHSIKDRMDQKRANKK